MTMVLVLMVAIATAALGDVPGKPEDEQAIRKVIRARELAWSNGDANGYKQLLTSDADISSATGRSASGSDAVLDLYSEQREGVYKGAITATSIESIRFIRADVALVNTNFRLTGLRTADGKALGERKGRLLIVQVKDQG